MIGRKGQAQFIFLLNPWVIGGLILLVVLLFFSGALLLWFLKQNILTIVGAFVLVVAGLTFLQGRVAPLVVWVIGALLLLLPFVTGIFDGFTLAALTSQAVG